MSPLNSIKQTLEQMKPALVEKYHISLLGLFGSVVRDDFSPSSDIDILVDFSQSIGIEFIDLANYIESRLEKPVDLVSKKGVKSSYMKDIEREIVYV